MLAVQASNTNDLKRSGFGEGDEVKSAFLGRIGNDGGDKPSTDIIMMDAKPHHQHHRHGHHVAGRKSRHSKHHHDHHHHPRRHSAPATTATAADNKTSFQPGNAGSQAGLAAVGAIAAYATVRGGIKLFHYARRSMLRQLLFDLCPALEGYDYWLDFGSLLGIYRDKDLILHDNDVDIAIYNPDWDELQAHLALALPQYGVKLHYPSEAAGESVFLRVYCALGFADIFGATEIDRERVLVDCGHGDTTAIDSSILLPIGTLEWRGLSIKVPGNLEKALVARYGPDWRTPRYMDKGSDTVEGNKTYAKVFRALSKFGIRL